MTAYKVVVDGSNIATEGRTSPSLTQLDEAVRAFLEEHPGADVLVVVDTSFPNKIDPAEHPIFESAYMANEIITPPAGTIGRGDAFILKIADKLGATVFSNDSFQEFHGTYEWLFDKGRLVGGKPIPGLGWVFTARNPVRGVKSREAVREAKRTKARIGSPEASLPMPVPKAPPPFLLKADEPSGSSNGASNGDRGGKRRRGRRIRENGSSEGAVATLPAERSSDARSSDARSSDARSSDARSSDARSSDAGDRKRKKRRRKSKGGDQRIVDAINEPLAFVTFVAENPIGAEIDGVVDTYSSHGFYVMVGAARCYVPLSGVAVPQPRAAKDVVRRGDTQRFIVRAFDAARRGIELALPGSPAAADLSGTSDVGASDVDTPADGGAGSTGAGPSRRGAKAKAKGRSAASEREAARPDQQPPAAKAQRSGGRKKAAVAVSAPSPVEGKPTGTDAAPPSPKKAGAKEAVVKKAVVKKAVVKKAVVKKSPPAKPAAAAASPGPAKATTARKAAKAVTAVTATPATVASDSKPSTAKKPPTAKKAAPATKTVPAKKAAPAKKATSPKRPAAAATTAASTGAAPSASPAKKVTPVKKATPAKKATPVKKAAAKAPAKKMSAKKTA